MFICYFHRFLVEDYLHEHYCTFEQFCVVSGFIYMVLIYFFFMIKREPLVDKTLIKNESAVTKQTKKGRFCFFQNILSETVFTTVKRIFKNTF